MPSTTTTPIKFRRHSPYKGKKSMENTRMGRKRPPCARCLMPYNEHFDDRKKMFRDTPFSDETYEGSIGRALCTAFCRECAGWMLFEALTHDPDRVKSLQGTPDRPFQQIPLKVIINACVDVAREQKLRPKDGEKYDMAMRKAIRERFMESSSHSSKSWWANDHASPFNTRWIETVLMPFIREAKLLPEVLLDPSSSSPVPVSFSAKARDFTHRVIVLLYVLENVTPLIETKILLPTSNVFSEGVDLNTWFHMFLSDFVDTAPMDFVTGTIEKMKEREKLDDVDSAARELSFIVHDNEVNNALKGIDNPRCDGYVYNEGVDGLSHHTDYEEEVPATQPFSDPLSPKGEILSCSQLTRARTF